MKMNLGKLFNVNTVATIVILFCIFYLLHVFFIRSTSHIEGLTNKDVLQDAIKELNASSDKIDRDIDVNDNKSSWEDYIIAYDKLIDLTILQSIKDSGDDIFENNEENMDKISYLNELYKLKENLNSSMDFFR